MDRENSPINSLLEQAACIIKRSKATAGTLEPTESYKRGQIEESQVHSCHYCLKLNLLFSPPPFYYNPNYQPLTNLQKEKKGSNWVH